MAWVPRITHKLGSHWFLDLAASQDQVVSRSQLAEAKVGRRLIGERVWSGTWEVLGPYVVVLRPGPLSRVQQMWVGVLHGGNDAVLFGTSALEMAGLKGFTDEHVSVCIPHGRHRPHLLTSRVTVRVHESRNLPAEDLHLTMRPPRTKQDRSVVDAASAATSDSACRTLLAMCVQQRLTAPVVLRPRVLERSNLPRRALILETLDDVEGGSQSLPELDYLRGLRRFGLPEPTRQVRVQRSDGRYFLDAEFDQWAVTVEINGLHHLDPRQKESDDIRRTRLAIGGRLVVDIGSHVVRHDIELAVLLTADALLARGWRPQVNLRASLRAIAERHPTFSWTSAAA
jgi:very-short-patch-repair endonuclease